MTDSKLDKDLVKDPSICTMLVRVGAGRVDVAVYSAMMDNSLIYRSIPVDTPEVSPVKALEEVVYDNPLMLCDFRKVYILTDSRDYALIPAAIEDESTAKKIFEALNPAFKGNVEVVTTSTRNATMAYGIESELGGFVNRTFPTATVMPHLLPLVRYFATKPGRGNSRRMLCNLRPASLDIVVIDGNSLMQANTIDFNAPMDAAYHILSSVSLNRLDPQSDEVLLAGDRKMREQLTPTLRNYLARVMPAIFPPQMFRAGREAMHAPFDLIITPLCE